MCLCRGPEKWVVVACRYLDLELTAGRPLTPTSIRPISTTNHTLRVFGYRIMCCTRSTRNTSTICLHKLVSKSRYNSNACPWLSKQSRMRMTLQDMWQLSRSFPDSSLFNTRMKPFPGVMLPSGTPNLVIQLSRR